MDRELGWGLSGVGRAGREHLLRHSRDLEWGDSQDSVRMTLAEMPIVGLWNLKRPPPVVRQYPQWRDGDTNTPSKYLNQNYSCL